MLLQWCRGEVCRHTSIEEAGEVALSARGAQVDMSYLISGEASCSEMKSVAVSSLVFSESSKRTPPGAGESIDIPRGRGDGSNASTCSASSEASFGELSTSSFGISAAEDTSAVLSSGEGEEGSSSRSAARSKGLDLHLDLSQVLDHQRAHLTLLPSNPPQVRYRTGNKYDKHGRSSSSSERGRVGGSRRSGSGYPGGTGSGTGSGPSLAELRRSVYAAERLLNASSRHSGRSAGSSASSTSSSHSDDGRHRQAQTAQTSTGGRRSSLALGSVFRRPQPPARTSRGPSSSSQMAGGYASALTTGRLGFSAGSSHQVCADLSPIVESVHSSQDMDGAAGLWAEPAPTSAFSAGPAPRHPSPRPL